MKKLVVICFVLFLVGSVSLANSTYHVKFDFETSWTGDYADGWENTSYRHGEAPVGKMMEQISGGYGGSGNAMKLIADSTPESWMWWAGVSVSDVAGYNMTKEYNPWFSAYYYDEGDSGGNDPAGQIFAVPSWVNGYTGTNKDEDWTDVQLGARDNVEDNYYSVACGQGMTGWEDTGIARTVGWHQLKMQLLDSDGKIHFYIDGVEAGETYRDDYIDLGSNLGLYTRFLAPLADWGTDKPYTIWDDVEFGSSAVVPVPGAVVLGGIGVGLVGWFRRRKSL